MRRIFVAVKYRFLFILVFISFSFYSQKLAVRVFSAYNLEKVDFSHHNGSYLIEADSLRFGAVLPNEFVTLKKKSNGKIELKHGVVLKGVFDTIRLIPTGKNFSLRIHPKNPQIIERRYQNAFTITTNNTSLVIVNNVDLDNYLAGVVESEGGGGKHLEYYKAQAVISRTYALKHKNKHKNEGYHLCDLVHCQAYHNELIYTPEIRKAVELTSNKVMVDTINQRLVDGYFHANCGGQTSRADFVWNEDVSYLQPFKDTFCIHTQQSTWEKRISKTEWRNYLVNQFHFPIQDSVYKNLVYTFEQEERKAFYLSPHLGIPLRDIRYHFKLKSTFFSCYPQGKDVIIKGKGFGHGIGLCQEGAMRMASSGLSYKEILKFYFNGIIVKNRFERLYFEQTPDFIYEKKK